MTTMVKLSELRFGHEYPGASLNARSTGRDDDIEALKASINSDGLLQSLLVCPAPNGSGGYYVIAGNRRLKALRSLVKEMDVPVIIRSDATPGTALAMSLSENITQVPLHPVDRFETFAALIDKGKTEFEIATNFAISAKTVKQSLALGRLSPKIRQAWRKGDLDAEAAQTFTLSTDHKRQDAVFERLKKGGRHQLGRWHIKNELVGDQQEVEHLLKLVGRAEYEKAGGTLQSDLFSQKGEADDTVVISDFTLLKRLADEKIKAKCEQLRADGWAWAEHEKDLPAGAGWNWQKVQKGSKTSPAAVKEKSGCIVQVNYNGDISVMYGVLKPGTKAAKEAETDSGKKKTAAKPSNKISNALSQRLESQLARATQDALMNDSYGTPLSALLAKVVASQIMPDRLNYTPKQVRDALGRVRDGITPKLMNETIRKRFDAKDYFSNAPKPLVLKAVQESVTSDEVAKLSSKTKAAVWKFALANVPATNWLPPELRTAHYDGPKVKQKATKPKTAKPQRKAA